MRTLKADSTLKRGNYVYTKNMRTLKSSYTKISVHKISVHKNQRTQKSAYTKISVHKNQRTQKSAYTDEIMTIR